MAFTWTNSVSKGTNITNNLFIEERQKLDSLLDSLCSSNNNGVNVSNRVTVDSYYSSDKNSYNLSVRSFCVYDSADFSNDVDYALDNTDKGALMGLGG